MAEKTNDEIRDFVKYLQSQMPGWKISWGYIGNIWQSPYIDDRSWRISMRPEGIMECWEQQDSYTIAHITNEEDHSIIFMFDEKNFFNWIGRQENRWNDYMLANFKNKMKGQTEKEVFINMMERMGYFGKTRCYSDETYFYSLTRLNCYGQKDEYTYAKFEAAFDTIGNLIEIRASS